MPKLARFTICIATLFFFFCIFPAITKAEYIVKPLLPEQKVSSLLDHQVEIIDNTQKNHIPSVTFGQILTDTVPEQVKNASVQKEKQIQAFLERFKQISDQSLEDLKNFYAQNISSISAKLSPSPSPYIPIPSLVAGVSDLMLNEPVVQLSNDDTDIKPTISSSPKVNEQSQQTKSTYTVAVLGDSMVDTLGSDLPDLRNLLKEEYPQKNFILLNYGQGATDLESGLFRLTNHTNYLEKDYVPLLSYKPDILVVESFAYNHWSGQLYDLDRQWLKLAEIVDTIKKNSPQTKVVLAASISPNSKIYGDGILNWPKELKWDASLVTKAYLQNLISFAKSQNIPLADAYTASLDSKGEGKSIYIDPYDNLHPSQKGARLFSQKILEAIVKNKLM